MPAFFLLDDEFYFGMLFGHACSLSRLDLANDFL